MIYIHLHVYIYMHVPTQRAKPGYCASDAPVESNPLFPTRTCRCCGGDRLCGRRRSATARCQVVQGVPGQAKNPAAMLRVSKPLAPAQGAASRACPAGRQRPGLDAVVRETRWVRRVRCLIHPGQLAPTVADLSRLSSLTQDGAAAARTPCPHQTLAPFCPPSCPASV